MRWKLQTFGRAGGISGEGVKNLLEASGFKTREDLIVREALQNSVDAHDDVKEHKVKVVLRKVTLKGKKKKEFVSLLGLDELAGIGPMLKTTPTDSPLRELDGSKPLDLLYIEDFNTVGLGGGLTDLKGNYYRLLFLVGDAQKAEMDEDLGGSYGYGKSVYASNSATSTIVAFSVMKPDAKTEGRYARLLGCTFQKAFSHAGKEYTGRGWFGGKEVKDEVPDPLADGDAMALAEKLGFRKRKKSDVGTSILLIGTELSGAELSIERIRKAIETWWWPRYVEDRLDIEFYEDDQMKSPPRPKQRPDLKPYIECYEQMPNGSSGEIRVNKFYAHPGTGFQMGSIALRAVSEDAFGALDPDEPGPGARRVAMMRGPLMVVDYHHFGSERREPFIGVYRASSDINTYLKLSEPKEHHRWDAKARRLQQRPHGTDVVESLYKRCSVQVRDFQASLAPKKEQPRDRLEALDRLLGAAFAPKAAGNGGDGAMPGKALIEFPAGVNRVAEGSEVKIQADIRIKLKPDQSSPQELTVKSEAVILQDSSRSPGRDEDDALDVRMLDGASGQLLASGVPATTTLKLYNDKWVKLHVTSAKYTPDWIAELRVTVE